MILSILMDFCMKFTLFLSEHFSVEVITLILATQLNGRILSGEMVNPLGCNQITEVGATFCTTAS